MRSFIDTNVVLYADASDEPRKQAVAIGRIETHVRAGSGVISTQVLHECAAGAIGKLSLPDDVVQGRVDLFSRFEVVTATVAALKAALALRAMHRLGVPGRIDRAGSPRCGLRRPAHRRPGRRQHAGRRDDRRPLC